MSQKYPVEIAQLFRSGFPSHIANPRFLALVRPIKGEDEPPACATIRAVAGLSSRSPNALRFS